MKDSIWILRSFGWHAALLFVWDSCVRFVRNLFRSSKPSGPKRGPGEFVIPGLLDNSFGTAVKTDVTRCQAYPQMPDNVSQMLSDGPEISGGLDIEPEDVDDDIPYHRDNSKTLH